MPTDSGPLLRTLCRAEVYSLMIGPAAVLAHAGELLPARPAARAARADCAGDRPRPGTAEPDPPRRHAHHQDLRQAPASPRRTMPCEACPFTSTAEPYSTGSPSSSTKIWDRSTSSHTRPRTHLGDLAVTHNGGAELIHGVLVPVAPIPALLGLAADGTSAHDHLMAQLHTIGSRPSPALHVVEDAATDGLDASGCDDHSPSATHHLEHAIEAVLPASPIP